MEVLIRSTASKNVREFHTSEQLTDDPYQKVLDTEMDGGGQFQGRTKQVLKALNDTADNRGIESVSIRPHSVKIQKNGSYSWSQLEPGILMALETVFGSTKARYARTRPSSTQAKVPA